MRRLAAFLGVGLGLAVASCSIDRLPKCSDVLASGCWACPCDNGGTPPPDPPESINPTFTLPDADAGDDGGDAGDASSDGSVDGGAP